MTKVVQHENAAWIEQHQRLLQAIYRDDPYYKDTSSPLLKMLLAPDSHFSKNVDVTPVTVYGASNTPQASTLYVIARNMPDILQVSFFEALPEQQTAVSLLIDHAKELAKTKHIPKIILGLDGHVNNGLGFLDGPCGSPPCFGSGYNPPYYIHYMNHIASPSITLVSYLYQLSDENHKLWRKVIQRTSRRFTIRTGRFKKFRQEIGIYTRLNNACFQDHPLYYERSEEEDYELFRAFGPFLKEEHFLIAELDGVPIGFLLWYPDFHELVKPGGKPGLGTVLKYYLPGNAVSKFKIAEIGVLPKHQGSGAIAGLIGTCLDICKHNGHTICESGWIFDANKKSRGVSERWKGSAHKTYKVFEINLDTTS